MGNRLSDLRKSENGPLFTDRDTRATGRDCYRCGKWFSAPVPDGRDVRIGPLPDENPHVHHGLFHFFRGGLTRPHMR